MAGADAEGAQWVKRQATGAEATADERVELVLLLDTTPAALVLEARRCGLELARRVPEGPAARQFTQSTGAGGRAADRFASAWAAHGCVDDPEVTVAHQVRGAQTKYFLYGAPKIHDHYGLSIFCMDKY